MTILAIETSCDETSAAVIEKRNGIAHILSNIIASQIKLHAKTGGAVPEVAAREHIKPIIPIIKLALKHAKIEHEDIDAIAVTNGPGLYTALAVGELRYENAVAPRAPRATDEDSVITSMLPVNPHLTSPLEKERDLSSVPLLIEERVG